MASAPVPVPVPAPPPLDWATLLWDFARLHPYLVLLNVVVVLLVPLNEVLLPHFYGKLVRAFQERRPLLSIMAVVAALVVGLRVAAYLLEPADARFGGDLSTFVRDRCLQIFMAVSESDTGGIHNGDVLARFSKLPICLEMIVGVWRGIVVPAMIGFLCCAAYLALFDLVLALTVVALAAVYLAMVLLVPQACSPESLRRDQAYNDIIEQIDDLLSNASAVFGQMQQAQERELVRQRGDAYTDAHLSTVWCYMPSYGAVTLVSLSFLVAFMFRTKVLMDRRAIDSATLVALTFIMMYCVNAVSRSTSVIRPLTHQYGILEGSSSILRDDDPDDATGPGPEPGGEPGERPYCDGVCMVDVGFKYPGSERPVLDSLTATFAARQLTVLWGAVGSGKSTVLKLLLKFVSPSSGEIFLWGVPYSALSPDDVRRLVAYVPQQPVLFDRSIRDNLTYGTDATDDEVADVVARLDLMSTRAFGGWPDGLDSPVGKLGSLLSGGQRQLVLIARAILSRPRIILLDEPSASLDANCRRLLVDCLSSLTGGSPSQPPLTVVVVTHDASLLPIADVVVDLNRHAPATEPRDAP